MFGRQRVRIKNSLTALFDKGNTPSMREILTNPDLAKSAQNGVPELVQYLAEDVNDRTGHLSELLDWVLTTNYREKEEDLFLSKNAANVLLEPAKEIQSTLVLNPVYAERVDAFFKEDWGQKPALILGNFVSLVERICITTSAAGTGCEYLTKRPWIYKHLKSRLGTATGRQLLHILLTGYESDLRPQTLPTFGDMIKDMISTEYVLDVFSLLVGVFQEQCDVAKKARTPDAINALLLAIWKNQQNRLLLRVGFHCLSLLLRDEDALTDEIRTTLSKFHYDTDIDWAKAAVGVLFDRYFTQPELVNAFFAKTCGDSFFRNEYITAYERLTNKRKLEVLRQANIISRIMEHFKGGCRPRNWHVVLLAEKIIRHTTYDPKDVPKDSPLRQKEWGTLAVKILSLVDYARKDTPEVSENTFRF